MFGDFEDSGTVDALFRLCSDMALEYDMPDLPSWILDVRMDFIIGTEAESGSEGGLKEEVQKVIPALAKLEEKIMIDAGLSESKAGSSDDGGGGSVHCVCLARLLLGACCEAYAILKCNRICHSGIRPTGLHANMKMKIIYKDSCHAAVWVSAHAQYLHDILHVGMNVSRPSLHTIKSELNENDLSELFSRRLAGKNGVNNDAACMLSLLTRCTNPGSRGWDSILSTSLEESDGTKRLCAEALAVSITGMHSCIHPASRLHWKKRLGLIIHLSEKSLLNSVTFLCRNPIAFKEMIRRLVCNTVSSSYASNDALQKLEHPVALLAGNIQRLCPDGVELASIAFAAAGKEIVRSRGSMSIEQALENTVKFDQQDNGAALKVAGQRAIQWSPAYLGKGSSSIHSKVAAATVASNIFAVAFRCNFIPFWAHCASNDLRASRLNKTQHNALHEMNAATKLTMHLTLQEQLEIQRIALKLPSSGRMTLEDVGKLFGLEGVRGSSCNGGSKSITDAVNTIGAAGAKGAAIILHFCRVAAISEDILIYDLGKRTYDMQLRAIIKRSLVGQLESNSKKSTEDLLKVIPEHTKHLCACVECKRVCNAIATDGGSKWSSSFNEIGTSGSMISTDPQSSNVHLRCAKRPSTSIKTAIAFEEEMDTRMIEADECKDYAVRSMLQTYNDNSGIAPRVRRDAKSSLEQRECSIACGQDAMLSIPIVGKAIRLWENWYALCSFCGCFMRFHQSNRFEAELCCMRCDNSMLGDKSNEDNKKPKESSNAPACRYCGKVCTS